MHLCKLKKEKKKIPSKVYLIQKDTELQFNFSATRINVLFISIYRLVVNNIVDHIWALILTDKKFIYC